MNSKLNIKLSEEYIKKIRDLEDSSSKIKLSEDDWDRFVKSFVYNTNAIEGSKLTKEEVEKIIDDN